MKRNDDSPAKTTRDRTSEELPSEGTSSKGNAEDKLPECNRLTAEEHAQITDVQVNEAKANMNELYSKSTDRLETQARAFEASVLEGKTRSEIAREFGVSARSISTYVSNEEQLRLRELQSRREAELVRQLKMVQRVINSSFDDRNEKGVGAYAAHTEALKQRAKLLGLDVAVKIDTGMSVIVDAISILEDVADEPTFAEIASIDEAEYETNANVEPIALADSSTTMRSTRYSLTSSVSRSAPHGIRSDWLELADAT